MIWVLGLVNSLNRPSVAPSLSLQQQELTLLAEPALPESLRLVLAGDQPRDALLEALRSSDAERTQNELTRDGASLDSKTQLNGSAFESVGRIEKSRWKI